jgi:hypothetical protein
MQSTIIFATGNAVIAGTATTTTLNLTIADGNGNSMPTGSDVVVKPVAVPGCGPAGTVNFTTKIANTLAPSLISLPLVNCNAGDSVLVEVTSPLKLVTRTAFVVQ